MIAVVASLIPLWFARRTPAIQSVVAGSIGDGPFWLAVRVLPE
jgi:hypothetical protein